MVLENKLGLTPILPNSHERKNELVKRKLLIYLTLPFSSYILTEHIRH